MFNSISNHFQSIGIPAKISDYVSDILTIKIHEHAVELVNILREEYGKPKNYICPSCEEILLKQSLHQDIATACDMPIEVVNKVMAGQDEVLDLE